MPESKMPLSDACTRQFDEWDASIAEWKKGNREIVKKKLEEMKKSIKAWIDEQTKKINKEKEETEESPIGKIIKKVVEYYKKLEKAISDLKDIVEDGIKVLNSIFDTIKSIVELVQELAKMILEKIADCTNAALIISTRGPQTLGSCVIPV